jgi:hypothetical protein
MGATVPVAHVGIAGLILHDAERVRGFDVPSRITAPVMLVFAPEPTYATSRATSSAPETRHCGIRVPTRSKISSPKRSRFRPVRVKPVPSHWVDADDVDGLIV